MGCLRQLGEFPETWECLHWYLQTLSSESREGSGRLQASLSLLGAWISWGEGFPCSFVPLRGSVNRACQCGICVCRLGPQQPHAAGLVRCIKLSSCGRDSEVILSSIGCTDKEAGTRGRERTGKEIGGSAFSWAVEAQPRVFSPPHCDVHILSSGSQANSLF